MINYRKVANKRLKDIEFFERDFMLKAIKEDSLRMEEEKRANG